MRILFMGTPDIAAACLAALLASKEHEIVGAVTQADRPKGRGQHFTPPPVKVVAEENGVPVYQPATLKDDGFATLLSSLAPDVIVVVAFGKILPPSVLRYPRYGCINLHASLLPLYRGAAPIQRAIMEGREKTGLTTMYMEEGLDTGDMLLVKEIPILPCDDFGTVCEKMEKEGGSLLLETIRQIETGEVTPKRQDGAQSTYAAKIEKEDCLLDFSLDAPRLSAIIRGLSPAPLAFTHREDGSLLKVVKAEIGEGKGKAGEVIALDDKGAGAITVACRGGALRLLTVVPEGKGKMSAGDLIRGRKITLGEVLS